MAPRDSPGFTCGLQPDIDPERIPAELASQYLLHLLDNTDDPDEEYKTLVHNVSSRLQPKPCNGSLALVQPTVPASSLLF